MAASALVSACGSGQDGQQAATTNPAAETAATALESTTSVELPRTTKDTTPAMTSAEAVAVEVPATTAPSTGAEARAALVPLLGTDLAGRCPLASDVELVADGQASWRTLPIEVSTDDRSVECVLRSAEGPPASLSVRATIDVASIEALLADDSLFMASAEPYAREDGELWVRCPSGQTVGDVPQTCEAYWIADDGQLAIVASMSAPAATLEEADYFGRRAIPKAVEWLRTAP